MKSYVERIHRKRIKFPAPLISSVRWRAEAVVGHMSLATIFLLFQSHPFVTAAHLSRIARCLRLNSHFWVTYISIQPVHLALHIECSAEIYSELFFLHRCSIAPDNNYLPRNAGPFGSCPATATCLAIMFIQLILIALGRAPRIGSSQFLLLCDINLQFIVFNLNN